MTQPRLSLRLAEFFTTILGPRRILKDVTQKFVTEVAALEDEYHTMEELYDFRMLMHAHLVNLWHLMAVYTTFKSKRHHDGELCFDGEYFIVVTDLPDGQYSNHYKLEHWDKFQVPAVELPPVWDGHTSKDALERLLYALPYNEKKVRESHQEWMRR